MNIIRYSNQMEPLCTEMCIWQNMRLSSSVLFKLDKTSVSKSFVYTQKKKLQTNPKTEEMFSWI